MKKYDYLIVGAGFTGAVLAERLSSIGKRVLVIDRRNHIGGNCYDFYDQQGVLIHKYGPHYFRTDFSEVKDYLSKYTEWIEQKYKIRACLNGRLYPLPINRMTLNQFFNISLKTEEETQKFLESKRKKIENPQNAEEQVLALTGKEIYKAFFENYSIKQWGIHPKKLAASVTARIPIRITTDDSYVDEAFQAMPKHGYFKIFEQLLKNVRVLLNTDFQEIKDKVDYNYLIYTGAIDEFFDYRFGKLPYRSLRFEFNTHDKEFYQDFVQINYPNNFKFTRIVEIKHVTKQKIPLTTISKEYPYAQGDPYYPIPNSENNRLYLNYKKEAGKLKNTHFVGRLATYRYLNMDRVVKEALELFLRLKDTL